MNPMQSQMMKMQMPMGMNFQGQGRGGNQHMGNNQQHKPRTQMGFTNKARNVGNPPENTNQTNNLQQVTNAAPTGPTSNNLAINFNRDF